MSAVGRMDGAFFVSRTELLSWVNSSFALNLSKVEQCSNGAVYCQIIDACHPGAVQMKKVNWAAREDHQCIPNFKVLQQAFDKVGIQRHIEVDKLVRGKYQDNLEMLQWIKTYFDRTHQGGDYDPVSRRFADNPLEWARSAGGEAQATPSGQAPKGGHVPGGTPAAASAGGAAPREPLPGAAGDGRAPARSLGGGRGGRASADGRRPGTAAEFEGLREEHEKLRDEVVDLKITVDGLETERDFYFQKLRDIEILCQALEAHPDPNMTVSKFVGNVQRILYAKDDEEEVADGSDAS